MYAIRSYYERALDQEPHARDRIVATLDGIHVHREDRGRDDGWRCRVLVITSYSIHYTKLYDFPQGLEILTKTRDQVGLGEKDVDREAHTELFA